MLLNCLSRLCTCALVMGLWSPMAQSLDSVAEAGWQNNMIAGMDKFKEADYVRAEKFFTAAYAQTKKLDGQDLKRVNSDIALGDLYRAMKRYSEAESYYKEALTALDNPGRPLPLIMILNKTASLYKDENRFTEAESAYKRSLTLAEEASGKDDVLVATISRNLAALYQKNGQFPEAERFAFRASQILSSKIKQMPEDYALSLYELASIQMLQKKVKQAVPNLEQALAILTKSLPPDDLRLACVEDALGTAYFSQKRYADAELLSRKALRIYEQKLEKDDIEVAVALSNLGFRTMSQEKFDEAEACFRRSLQMQEKKLGLGSFETLSNLEGLAEVYAKKHDYKKCENELRAILAVKEKRYGKDSAPLISALINLSNCLAFDGKKNGEAENLLRRADSIKQTVPDQHREKINQLIQAELMKL